ncbi:MAG: DUF167 domain-containing protein [Nitrosospira sp.]
MPPLLIHRSWHRSHEGGHRLTLTLNIQPGAKRTEVAGLHGDALKIRLAAPPVEGAANAALREFLAEVFSVPLRQVTLKHGVKSRRKVAEVWQPALGPEVLFKQITDS